MDEPALRTRETIISEQHVKPARPMRHPMRKLGKYVASAVHMGPRANIRYCQQSWTCDTWILGHRLSSMSNPRELHNSGVVRAVAQLVINKACSSYKRIFLPWCLLIHTERRKVPYVPAWVIKYIIQIQILGPGQDQQALKCCIFLFQNKELKSAINILESLKNEYKGERGRCWPSVDDNHYYYYPSWYTKHYLQTGHSHSSCSGASVYPMCMTRRHWGHLNQGAPKPFTPQCFPCRAWFCYACLAPGSTQSNGLSLYPP